MGIIRLVATTLLVSLVLQTKSSDFVITIIDLITQGRHVGNCTVALLEDVGVVLDSLVDVGVIHMGVILVLAILLCWTLQHSSS